MPLNGRAFLAIWHDIAAEGEAEYAEWHTRQHMPERLGVPGFLAGRRGVNWALGRHRWFTLYEAATLETFSSAGYRARLDAPTRWSGRVQPHFRNFVRSACTVSASVGRGVGGAMVTARLEAGPAELAELEAQALVLAHRFAGLPGVVGAHLGTASPATTRIDTAESRLRAATGEEVFDAVALIDTTGAREADALLPEARAMLEAVLPGRGSQWDRYDLAQYLTSADP